MYRYGSLLYEQDIQQTKAEESLVKKFSEALEEVKKKIKNEIETVLNQKDQYIKKIIEFSSNQLDENSAENLLKEYISDKEQILNSVVDSFEEIIKDHNSENTLKNKKSLVEILKSRVREKINGKIPGSFGTNKSPVKAIDGKIDKYLQSGKLVKEIFEIRNINFLKVVVANTEDKSADNLVAVVHMSLRHYFTNEGLEPLIERTYILLSGSNFFKQVINKVKEELLKLFPGLEKEKTITGKLRILKDGFVNIIKNPKDHKYALGVLLIIFLIIVAVIMKIPFLRKFFGKVKKLITAPFNKASALLSTLLVEQRINMYLHNPVYRKLHESKIRKIDFYVELYSTL